VFSLATTGDGEVLILLWPSAYSVAKSILFGLGDKKEQRTVRTGGTAWRLILLKREQPVVVCMASKECLVPCIKRKTGVCCVCSFAPLAGAGNKQIAKRQLKQYIYGI
jgi:hypothetical protein